MTTMNLQPSSPAFYKHSGRISTAALSVGLVAAPLVGFVVGSLVGPLEILGHMVVYLKLMLLIEGFTVIGGGALLGFIMAKLLVRLHCRSIVLLDLSVFLAGVIAMYFAWAGWLYAFVLTVHGDSTYPFLAQPRNLFHAMAVINRVGTWYISKTDQPAGIALTSIWIIEAGTLLLTAGIVAHREFSRCVFCETCRAWGTKRHLMKISDANFADLKTALLAGRTDVFDTVTRSPGGALTWCDVTLEGCPTCDNLQTLTLQRTVLTPAKNNKVNTKTTRLVKRLLLTPDQTAQIALTAASLQSPLPSTPTAS